LASPRATCHSVMEDYRGADHPDHLSPDSPCQDDDDSVVKNSFVHKLFELVEQEPDEIVGFIGDGSSFEVKDPRRLEAEVLPKYFRHSRFQSLVRQLNFYNFKKVSKERHMWVYHHELFHRDKPALLDKLKRKTSQMMPEGAPQPLRRTFSTCDHLGSTGNSLRRIASESSIQTLGSVWREVFDVSSGQVYYWNTFTGHIQWDEPPDYEYHQNHPDFRVETRAPGDAGSTEGSRTPDELDSASVESSTPRSTLAEEPGALKRKASTPPADEQAMGDGSPTTMVQNSARAKRAFNPEARKPMAADNYYADKDGTPAWEALKVSAEVLGALQRALYERQTSPALVALVTFGLRTTPYQKPSMLLSAFREKLNSHNELWNELRRYREALEPRAECLLQYSESGKARGSAMYVEQVANLSQLDPKARAKSEMCMMREFMAFVVTRLQMVHDLCETNAKSPLVPDHQKLLAGCLKLWWDHANRYL